MNCTTKSAAGAAAVATKIAAKEAAKQAPEQPAAEQPEAKQKTKTEAKAPADETTKGEATKEVAEHLMSEEDAAPAKAKKDASSVCALVLIGVVAAAFCATFTPHMTKPRVASELEESNHPVAVPLQWLPALLAFSSSHIDSPTPRFEGEDLPFEALSMERRMTEGADPDCGSQEYLQGVWACYQRCRRDHPYDYSTFMWPPGNVKCVAECPALCSPPPPSPLLSPSPPSPSPPPPPPPSPPPIFSAITCSSDSYSKEVAWSLSCSDGTTLSGGASYPSSYKMPVAVAYGATCTLEMNDSYGDGWSGAVWAAPGFGQSFSLAKADGYQGTESFVVQFQPPPSPPLAPPPSPSPPSPPSPPPPCISRSRNTQCGPAFGACGHTYQPLILGRCCSQFNWCGEGSAYCGAGNQAVYSS